VNRNQPIRANASSLHRRVHAILKELYPNFTLTEEAPVKVNVGGRITTVFVDIKVAELGLAIECQGKQHDEFVPHFHGTRLDFARARERDRAKAQAILESGLSYLAISFRHEKSLTQRRLLKMISQAIRSTT